MQVNRISYPHAALPLEEPAFQEAPIVDAPVYDAPFQHSEFAPSKPRLKAPELMIMDMDQKLKRLSKRTMALSLNKIDHENSLLEKLIGQQIDADTDLSDSQNQAFIWTILKNIGSCIMAVFNMVFGGFLISTGGGTAAGSALVASGFLALANVALSEAGGWNWIAECMEGESKDKQEMIAIILPVIVATLSIGLSLAGFADVAQVHNADDITALLTRGIQMISGAGHLGAAYGDHEVLKVQSRANGIEKGMIFSEKHIDIASRVFEELMREFDHVSSQVKKMIKQAIYESRAVTMA